MSKEIIMKQPVGAAAAMLLSVVCGGGVYLLFSDTVFNEAELTPSVQICGPENRDELALFVRECVGVGNSGSEECLRTAERIICPYEPHYRIKRGGIHWYWSSPRPCSAAKLPAERVVCSMDVQP